VAKCEWLTCKVCQREFRTRVQRVMEAKLCPKCLFERAVSQEVALRKAEEPAAQAQAPAKPDHGYQLAHARMPERWYHELLFRQCELDGLVGMGYGKLNFLHPNQKMIQRMGRWIEGGMEFDFLLKDFESGRHIGIELKKCADEFSVGQVLKYMGFLGGHPKVKDFAFAIVTVELTAEFERTIRTAWKNGLKLDLFVLSVQDGQFFLRKIAQEVQ
jgi:hypothetical protein